MERNPNLKLSIELTKGEAQSLLAYLGRFLPVDLGSALREDARLFNRASKRLLAALEKELVDVAKKPGQGARRERAAMKPRRCKGGIGIHGANTSAGPRTQAHPNTRFTVLRISLRVNGLAMTQATFPFNCSARLSSLTNPRNQGDLQSR